MKYLRLLEETNDLVNDVLQDNKTDYPLVSLLKTNKTVNFIKPPIAKAIINVDSENYDYYLNDSYNIKKLWIDNQLAYNKNLWVKYEDTISMNDFGKGNFELTTFNKAYLFTRINQDSANVRIKSTEKITRFYLMISDLYSYGIEYVSGEFIDFDTLNSFPFQVKKIDDYTYDIIGLFKYDSFERKEHLLLLGATDSDAIPEQTISYEILEEDKPRQSMTINRDNAFDLHNHGTNISITGDFNENDLLLINLILDGEILDNTVIPIQTIVEYGLGSFNNNVFDCNLESIGIISNGLTASYAIIDGSFNDSYVENIEDVLPYIKNVTITFSPTFIYPVLEDGEHELKFEVISQEMLPNLNRDLVKKLDLSKLVGMETIFEYDYRNLTSIIIPDSVTSIADRAFESCNDLISVNLGNGVITIGGSAFAYCVSLTSITIPDSVTSIGTYAFHSCDNLTEITCYAVTAPSVEMSFTYMPTNGVLKVPSGSDYSSWLSELPSGWVVEYI